MLKIRDMLTDEIGGLADDEVLVPHLQTMRAACRRFVDQMTSATDGDGRPHRLWVAYQPLDDREFPLVVALGELCSALRVI